MRSIYHSCLGHKFSLSQDLLEMVLPFDEAILEAMSIMERSWKDMLQRASFLFATSGLRIDEHGIIIHGSMEWYRSPLTTYELYAEGNMSNISKTISINISRTFGVIENIFKSVDCSRWKIEIYTALFKEYHNVFA